MEQTRKEGENYMEQNQESKDEQNSKEDISSEKTVQSMIQQWLQDNLRIIVSILIVVVIAISIYSYSNRSQNDLPAEQDVQSTVLEDQTSYDEDVEIEAESNENVTEEAGQTSSITTSHETEQSFIETAGKGDSTTKLARKALLDYLEKNADSSLTPEHKIYIEDYLRKNVNHEGNVHIGTSIEFSKSSIENAITESKNLNEQQLKNLHKYALLVPSLF